MKNIVKEVTQMKEEKRKKKGLFSVIRESMIKTGGCCGPGETCGGPSRENDKAEAKDKAADKQKKT
jgi:hypothetical protein